MQSALSRRPEVSAADVAECLRVLEALVDTARGSPKSIWRLATACLSPPGGCPGRSGPSSASLRVALGRKKRKAIRDSDQQKRQTAGIRQKRLEPTFVTPDPLLAGASDGSEKSEAWDAPELENPVGCYVCKRPCTKVHFFYDQMCGPCGDENYRKRSQTADLRGRVAFISGARVKIGYQAAMLLLRAGAHVVVSTRFPRDAARRYSEERDFEDFRDRLQIYGLDLRHAASVNAFAAHLTDTLDRLDFVLHNACQTVRRPAGFYGPPHGKRARRNRGPAGARPRARARPRGVARCATPGGGGCRARHRLARRGRDRSQRCRRSC